VGEVALVCKKEKGNLEVLQDLGQQPATLADVSKAQAAG
jgi:hypothetical protein